ncbi:hemolysin activation/secretion protein [Rhizomicrobium palustre]|uniref:Hemolysin activation/secretion protein n=1 Tax=Rhizomicrobium palustre TaxID=189966 RepID=A0A846N1S6_9PROT|nr:ShlB/FhaC/HecB family hemolysin secretion/activation protein [Rhizomicrobium palustre]NIK89172.1 hemolysin activation/secretion protein [Rhizomicrobium palustre]
MRFTRCLLAAGPAFIACAVSSIAAEVPSQVAPGAVERTLQQKLPTAHEDRIQIPAPSGFDTPQGAEKVHFTLSRIDLSGNTAVPSSRLASAYAGLIGKDVSLADVFAVARKITDQYREAGYALSFALVPAQELDPATGAVRIDVVEGYIAEIRFEGAHNKLPSVVTAMGERIKQSHPLKTADLEKYLLLMNDVPGFAVSGVFDRIPDAPKGATRLVVKTSQQSWTASASIDNRGSSAFGPWQSSITAAAYDLIGQGEDVSLHGIRALNGKQLSAVVGQMSFPISDNGTRLSFNGIWSDAHPGSPTLSAINFGSSGWTYGASLNYPLLRSRLESLWLRTGVTGKLLKSQFLATPHSRDRIYEWNLGATWNKRDETGVTTGDITFTQGLPLGDVSDVTDALRSRSTGSAIFSSVEATITRLQSVLDTKYGALDLYGAAQGQVASRGLLSSEQCGYGGAVFGKAYDSNEMVGDFCALGALEARVTPASVFLPFPKVLTGAQFFASVDFGYTSNTGKLGFGDKTKDTASSVGAGLRFSLFQRVNGSVEYDLPISRKVALEGNSDGRVFFQLSISAN